MVVNPYQVTAQTIPKGSWRFCLTSHQLTPNGQTAPKLITFGYVVPEVGGHLQRLCDKPQLHNDPAQLLRFEGSNIIPKDESSQDALETIFKEVCCRLHSDPHAKLLWGKAKPVVDEATPVLGAAIPFNMIYGVVPLFGIVTSGAHLNVFHGEGENMLIWLAQRGATKASYPSCFDQIVAGGNDSGRDRNPVDIIRREAKEEVNDLEIHARLETIDRPDATITYHIINPTKGLSATIAAGKIEAGVRYVFDYEVQDPNCVFKKNEEDIANMRSYTVTQVKEMLRAGRFKPNCGFVMLNFLIRKGIIKPGDPWYQETERSLELPHIWMAN